MKTRNKSIIDQLECEGLSVNYQWVEKIQKVVCKKLRNLHDQDRIVCTRGLKSDIFTTSAIANIDHKQSSNTGKKSLHGSSFTIFQHPDMPI